jgi:transcriptional regulator with XRE-family HTH domain
LFWEDLSHDLDDPEFLREYIVESVRIATIDRVINSLDSAREAASLSKADLARAVGLEPAVVRRLFSAQHVNPTLGTVAEIAASLGMRLTLEPLPAEDRKVVTEPLLGLVAEPRGAIGAARTARRGAITVSAKAPAKAGAEKSGRGNVPARDGRQMKERGLSARYSAPRSRTPA